MKLILTTLMICLSSSVVHAGWMLKHSVVKYQVVHLLHKVDGTSTQARGKGQCADKGCEFLIAAEVKSFDSGNSNRDSHVQEVAGAGIHPLVSVRFHTSTSDVREVIPAQATVELNGKSVQTPVQLKTISQNGAVETSGELHLRFSDFQMKRPSLLGVSVDDEFKVDFKGTWEKN